ncbi:MAG TPA: AbrB/MazE/SpoVT family DNA-binding domain-containing protein [Egicoccus sp.]|nr:AbrB/MazE/SpoVT family DNA-binding domain-containing protein [Egicoccus sp.]HSK22530.1 AbrB/MazE/SpoVT family DNA-binding domain-containing protein [Egicoccus sp.]
MASSGIRRKVDDLGRVVIPAGIRRSLSMREGDTVEVTVEGERVVISRPQDACVFCGREEDDLQGFRGRLVCRDCLGSLGVLDERTRATEVAAFEPVAADPEADVPATPEVEDDGTPRTPWERTRRPAAHAGPIDGDAYARQRAEEAPPRRRPPQDPASTTAW